MCKSLNKFLHNLVNYMMVWLACSFFLSNEEDHSSLNESWIEIFIYIFFYLPLEKPAILYITFPLSTRQATRIKK